MSNVTCIASALSPEDCTIALWDGQPVIAQVALHDGQPIVQVYEAQPGDAVHNPCDGVLWTQVDGRWDAVLRVNEIVVDQSPVTRAPACRLDPRADADVIRALEADAAVDLEGA